MTGERVSPWTGSDWVAHAYVFAIELILLAYYLSVWKYKTWYIATATVLVLTVFLWVCNALEVGGVIRAVVPLAIYFLYLGVAALGSIAPRVAGWWALADSVGVVIAALFWIMARNSSPADQSALFQRVPFWSLIINVALLMVYGPAARLGGWSLTVVPFTLPFGVATLMRKGPHRTRALLSVVIGLGIAIVSRSRAAVGASLIAVGLSVIFFTSGTWRRVVKASVAGVLIAVMLLILAWIPQTRLMVLITVSRFTNTDVVEGNVYVPAEGEDRHRRQLNALFKEMVWDAQPFGIGYTTMSQHYLKRYDIPMPLHSMYQTWILEGGIVCVFLVAWILLRHFAGLRYAVRFGASPEARDMARCVAIGTVAILTFGAFHQLHRAPVFFIALGLALGWRDRAAITGPLRHRLLRMFFAGDRHGHGIQPLGVKH